MPERVIPERERERDRDRKSSVLESKRMRESVCRGEGE